MNLWDQIRNHLQQQISPEGYDNWLRGTSFAGIDGTTLFVSVPDRETRAWLETEYAALVRDAIRDLGLPFSTSVSNRTLRTVSRTRLRHPCDPTEFDSRTSPLNPKFTFQTFVVGACNQFAHAAAQSVADESLAQL